MENESLRPQVAGEVSQSCIRVVPKRGRSKSPSPAFDELAGRRSQTRNNSSVSVTSSLVKGTTRLCFRMSDVAVSLLVLLPLTIAFWRGIWQIMDHYSVEYSVDPWLSIGVGNGIPLLLYWFQEPLKRYVHPRKMNFVLFYVTTRLLLLLHSFGSVNQWRGLWVLLDNETGLGKESNLITLFVGVIVAIPLKVFNNVLATPLVVGVDEATNVHDCPLRYKSLPESPWRYFLDCAYSVLVVQSLVVFAWRGLWNLADLYLYPEDKFLSYIVSVAVGSGIAIGLCILQPCHYKFMTSLKGIFRVGVSDVVTTFGFVACVLTWRGTWELYNVLLIFETPLRSEWVTTIIGAIGSALLGCISTVVVRGVTVDGDDAEDGTMEWPISYISLLQKRHHYVPFPEPWLFRYLCTSQKMKPVHSLPEQNSKNRENYKNASKMEKGEGSPLKVIKNVHPADSTSDDHPRKTQNAIVNELKDMGSSMEDDSSSRT